jgi:hypothetical protein
VTVSLGSLRGGIGLYSEVEASCYSWVRLVELDSLSRGRRAPRASSHVFESRSQ